MSESIKQLLFDRFNFPFWFCMQIIIKLRGNKNNNELNQI